MVEGIMVYDELEWDWKIWIGKNAFEVFLDMELEICIQGHFYKATIDKDYFEWFITIEDEVDFRFRLVETYKIKIREESLVPTMDLPF